MKIVFLSNYFNHHQKAISEQLNKSCSSYVFVSTMKMREERKQLGYGEETIPNYVIEYNEKNSLMVNEYLEKSDVIIHGSAKIKDRKRIKYTNKIILPYSERLLKKSNSKIKYIPRFIKLHRKAYKSRRTYLLCASAYAAYDYSQFFMYRNQTYKWGYFPETKYYAIHELIKNKEKKTILWCGRFLDWKHPDDVIEIGKKLIEDGYEFEINFIGSGQLEEQLRSAVRKMELENYIHFFGSMKPEEVRKHMEETGIFLFTSDKQEGWGAVLNEAMNSGCAVIASHAIGAVPYLINNNENGLIYKSGDINKLYEKVKYLLDNPEKQEELGKAAYTTISELWNANVAVERLLNLVETVSKGEIFPDIYPDGPCSKAEIIKDDWFYDE